MERTAAEEGTPTNSAQATPSSVPSSSDAAVSAVPLAPEPIAHEAAPEGESVPADLSVAPESTPATQQPSEVVPDQGANDGGDLPNSAPNREADQPAPLAHAPSPALVEVTGLATLHDEHHVSSDSGHATVSESVLDLLDEDHTDTDPQAHELDDLDAKDPPLAAPLIPLADMPGLMAPQVEPPVPAIAFWRRSIILGGVVAALGGLTLWEHSTIPDRPASPVITVATPAPNATPLDPGMADALRKVRTALVAHDVVSLAGMVDPDGLVVGPYAGGIPESGYPIPETKSFLSNVMTDARLVTPGWRTDPRGRIFLLVDGWRTRPLSLSPNSTLELTPLVAIVMQARNGVWAIRWFLIDATGILTQQARNVTWQAVP